MTRRTINRQGQPPERYISLPLDVQAAAVEIRKRFTPEQVRELARLLHWGGKEEK